MEDVLGVLEALCNLWSMANITNKLATHVNALVEHASAHNLSDVELDIQLEFQAISMELMQSKTHATL
jgi:hypothetical protein